MSQVTYKQLFEKYARRERDRYVLSVVMGSLGVIGAVLAALRLRELQQDRHAAAAITSRRRTP